MPNMVMVISVLTVKKHLRNSQFIKRINAHNPSLIQNAMASSSTSMQQKNPISQKFQRKRRPNQRGNKMSVGNDSCLPEEVIQEILFRLPIKPLVRCTCVSKLWYSIIKNPTFISTHLRKSPSFTAPEENNSNSDPLLLVRWFSDNSTLYTLGFGEDKVEAKERKMTLSDSGLEVRGLCNGLVCFSDEWGTICETIVLWNPLIRKSFTLPKPTPLSKQSPDGKGCYLINYLVGLGFDSKYNDFKVLRIAQCWDIMGAFPIFVEVYSLTLNSWKSVSNVDSFSLSGLAYGWLCFASGSLHFLVSSADVDGLNRVNVIMGFNVTDEVIREVALPECLHRTSLADLYVVEYRAGGSSSIAVADQRHGSRGELWAMRTYGVVESWTKLGNVADVQYVSRVLGFRKDGDVLLERYGFDYYQDQEVGCLVAKADSYRCGILSYDLESQRLKHLKTWYGGFPLRSYCCVASHMQSLVLLDIGECVNDEGCVGNAENIV